MHLENELWVKNVSLTRFITAGLVLEFVGSAFLFPFYYCKTHLQVNEGKCAANPMTALCNEIKTTKHKYGIKGLYRGFVWSTLTSFPGIIAHVGMYNVLKNHISFENPIVNNTLSPFISGLLAEAVSAIIYVPSDVTTGRYILTRRTETLSDVLKTVYKEHGMLGFWQGSVASLNTYVPSAGIWWAAYEISKYITNSETLFGYTFCGMFAGTATAILTNPMDVIRTRLTTQTANYNERKFFNLMKTIYAKEGINAFGKGVGARFSLLLIEGLAFAYFYEILMYLSTMPLPIIDNQLGQYAKKKDVDIIFRTYNETHPDYQNFAK